MKRQYQTDFNYFGMILPPVFYDAFAMGICAEFSIFSMKIP